VGQLRATVSAGGRTLTIGQRLALLVFAVTLLVAAGPLGPARAQAPAPAGPSAVELTDATIVEHERAVEVWVRLTRETKYQSESMDGPDRLVLDFEDTTYRWTKVAIPVVADPVRVLRGSQFKKGVARLVIELQRKVPYTIESDREGLRIVIPKSDKPTPAPAGTRVLATPMVYGIIRLDDRAHAYIFDPATRQVRRYAEGDTLGDAVVETIAERHVVLRTPTGRVELKVPDSKADPRPSEAPPARVKPAPAPVGPSPSPPRS
jgi:hypothetical protein